jgi:hypothetical protein
MIQHCKFAEATRRISQPHPSIEATITFDLQVLEVPAQKGRTWIEGVS